jgi:TatD DNase family protein
MLDAHCHIDLYDDPYQVAVESEQHRIFTLAVTRLPSHFAEACEYLTSFRYVRPGLGFHPLLASNYPQEISAFEALVSSARYVGEIGLDFTVRTEEKKRQQIELLEHILSLTHNQDQVFSVHSRWAEAQVLDLLLRHGCRKCIFHWYSGSIKTLHKIIDAGYYLSINYQMLISKNGRNIIQATPLDRILTETDGPFIKVDGRDIRPTDIKFTEQKLAELLVLSPQDVTNKIRQNLRDLLTGDFATLNPVYTVTPSSLANQIPPRMDANRQQTAERRLRRRSSFGIE